MYHNFFIHSFAHGHRSSFQVLAIINNAALNIEDVTWVFFNSRFLKVYVQYNEGGVSCSYLKFSVFLCTIYHLNIMKTYGKRDSIFFLMASNFCISINMFSILTPIKVNLIPANSSL